METLNYSHIKIQNLFLMHINQNFKLVIRFISQISTGGLSTGYLVGYGIAMSTFTPVKYIPGQGKVTYYKKVTIVIETATNNKAVEALNNQTSSIIAKSRLLNFAQKSWRYSLYNSSQKRSDNNYSLLIITPDQFTNGFNELRNYLFK